MAAQITRDDAVSAHVTTLKPPAPTKKLSEIANLSEMENRRLPNAVPTVAHQRAKLSSSASEQGERERQPPSGLARSCRVLILTPSSLCMLLYSLG